MFQPRFLLLASLALCSSSARAQTPAIASVPLAGQRLEAQTARELAMVAPLVSKPGASDASDSQRTLALAFARLGRVEAGLRAASAMEPQKTGVSNGASQTRDEVRRLSARRSAVLGHIKAARTLALEIKDHRLRADALFSVARAQTRTGDIAGTRQTLFQTLALVPQDVRAQLAIAVELSHAKQQDAAKRLLARVEHSLPPLKKNQYGQYSLSEGALHDWGALGQAYVRAGMWDDAERLNRVVAPIDSQLSEALLDAGRFDLALQRAQSRPARTLDERVGQLWALSGVAQALVRVRPAGAALLVRSLRQEMKTLPLEYKREPNTFYQMPPEGFYNTQRAYLIIGLAALLREMGDEAGAQALFQPLVADQPPEQAASSRFALALAPLEMEWRSSLTPVRLSRAEIERITTEVEPLLNSPEPHSRALLFIPPLVDAAIEAGARDEARQLLLSLEPLALEEENDRGNPDVLNLALKLAQKWQKLGNASHVQELLVRLWDSPTARSVAPRARAEKFIVAGFTSEGEARRSELGIAPNAPVLVESLDYQKVPQGGVSPAFYAGIANDALAMPLWIEEQSDPQKRLAALAAFTTGLSERLFNSRDEREFAFSSNSEGTSF